MRDKAKGKIYSLYTFVAGYLFVSYLETQAAMCDIFDDITNVSNNALTKVVGVATALLPLVVAITLVCIIFTRDQRKLAGEISILVSSVIAFILLIIIQRGNLSETLRNIVT